MEIIIKNVPFKLCEEIVENLEHLFGETSTTEQELIDRLGKSASYIKKSIRFLMQLDILRIQEGNVFIYQDIKDKLLSGKIVPIALIKSYIVNYAPFKEYMNLLQQNKKSDFAARLIKSKFKITNDTNDIILSFGQWLKYLDNKIEIKKNPKIVNFFSKETNFLWFNELGELSFDEEGYMKKIIHQLRNEVTENNTFFIDPIKLEKLKKIINDKFDLSKLIKICEEINDGYKFGNYYTVGLLCRVIIDHIPPIFEKKNFAEVASNVGSKSFKDAMFNLDNFTRKVADSMIHSHIRKKEILPSIITIDCKNAMDVLLGEIIVLLS